MKQLDWQPSDSYGSVVTTVVPPATTEVTVNRPILSSTQIAFFEDEIILLRTIGHCKVSFVADMPPGNVNIAMRLRIVLENQTTGALASAGDDLDDTAVAEESFLSEKRYRLSQRVPPDTRDTVASARNDYVVLDPYFANWDVPAVRKLQIPAALVLSVRVDGALPGDSITVTDFFRCLIRH